MSRRFSWLSGRESSRQRSSTQRGQFRPAVESLEQRQVMATFGIEFDSFYEVPVLAIRGTDARDNVTVYVSDKNTLNVIVHDGATAKTTSFDLQGGKFSPGYIFFNGYGGDDDFANLTTIPSLIQGGPGDDKLMGGGGPDRILAGSGSDTIRGFGGEDQLFGGWENAKGADVDFVYGGSGADHIHLGSSKSFAYGGFGNDLLEGGDGVDTLYGEEGNDFLLGGNAADFLWGGPDHDHLRGGLDGARDNLYGGTGNDTFYKDGDFSNYEEAIHDEESSDQIGSLNGLGSSGGNQAVWVREVKAAHRDGNARYYHGAYEDRVSSALTVDEGLSAQFLVQELGISAVHLTESPEVIESYFDELALAEFSSAAIDAETSLFDGDEAALHDAALLALLAEASPSIGDTGSEAIIDPSEALAGETLFSASEEFEFWFSASLLDGELLLPDLLVSGLFEEPATMVEGNYVELIPVEYSLLDADEALLVADSSPFEADEALLAPVSIADLEIGSYDEQNELLPIGPITTWGPQDPILEASLLYFVHSG